MTIYGPSHRASKANYTAPAAGVARGYWNHPTFTAERFLPDIEDRHAKMYRTGDRAVLGNDGELRFLGRRDTQLKILGFRIEAGELEAALHQHPAVAQAVVLDVELSAIKQLGMSIILKSGMTATMADLQAFLRAKLPEYMIPTLSVFVDVMPYGPTGKLNRDALRSMMQNRSAVAVPPVSTRNPLEAKIAARFAENLQLDAIGVDDNYFTVGGRSLSASQLLTDLCEDISIFARRPGEDVAKLYAALSQAFAKKPTIRTVSIFAMRQKMAAGV